MQWTPAVVAYRSRRARFAGTVHALARALVLALQTTVHDARLDAESEVSRPPPLPGGEELITVSEYRLAGERGAALMSVPPACSP
jgi:hypothetical protein